MKGYAHLLGICFIALVFIFNNVIWALNTTSSKNGGGNTINATTIPTTNPTSTINFTPTPTPTQNINMLIFTRQHGNEPAGTTAIFSYISDLVNSSNNTSRYAFDNKQIMSYEGMIDEIKKITQIKSNTLDIQVSKIGESVNGNLLYLIKIQLTPGLQEDNQLPDGITLLFVPMVNPDGAIANNRDNANRKNLNRDWDELTQPETQAVYNKVYKVYNPEIVLDLHEFSAFDYRKFDMTYYPGFGDKSPAQLIGLYTSFEKIVDIKLKYNHIACDKISSQMETWVKNDTSFGGNHFAIKDFAINYTIETKGIPAKSSLPSIEDRVNMQRTFFEAMIAYAAGNKAQIINTISKLRTSK